MKIGEMIDVEAIRQKMVKDDGFSVEKIQFSIDRRRTSTEKSWDLIQEFPPQVLSRVFGELANRPATDSKLIPR